MSQLDAVTLLVKDYDEAIRYFVGRVGFHLIEDSQVGDGKRWVRVRPAARRGCSLLLARADTEEALASVGRQAGGRVGFFLHSDNFDADHERMRDAGVRFEEQPRDEAYGRVAVWRDLYGNRWDLIGPRAKVTVR